MTNRDDVQNFYLENEDDELLAAIRSIMPTEADLLEMDDATRALENDNDDIVDFFVQGGRAPAAAVDAIPSGGDVGYEELSVKYKKAMRGRVNQVVTKVRINEGSSDALDTHKFIFPVIEDLLEKYLHKPAKPDDKGYIIFYTDKMEHPVSSGVRPLSSFTVDQILVLVEKAQQSGVTIDLKQNLCFEFVHIKIDQGWGVVDQDVLPGSGRGSKHLLSFGQQLKKKSIVESPNIINGGDKMCMAKALIIGKAKLEWEEAQTTKLRKKKGGNAEYKAKATEAEAELEKRYHQLSRKRGGKNRALAQAVEALYQEAGMEFNTMGDLTALGKFEDILDICVKVVSIPRMVSFVYKGKPRPHVVYLCYSENPETDEGHYDLISNVRGFFSTHFYCTRCDHPYFNITDHRCEDITNWCFSCYKPECQNQPTTDTCTDCPAIFRSATCKENHKALNCHLKWKCLKCRNKFARQRQQDGALFTDLEMEQNHSCIGYFCSECDKNVEDDHLCYVKKTGVKEHTQKLVFFDTETDQSSGEHKVNFVHMRYFVPASSEVGKKIPADHEEWEGSWKERSFEGYSALHEFLVFLLKDKKTFKGYTVIAHNLRGFDGVLVLKHLLQNGICPEMINNGQKIMTMTIKTCNVRFIDSFNFLPMGLAKLPKAFGLDCGNKGYFPHFFNTVANQNYVGPLPDQRFYGSDTMSKEDKASFEKWYQQQQQGNVVFNFKTEMAAYCKQDVDILAESCLAYRRLMCKETGCDPFVYTTLASVCNAVYRCVLFFITHTFL
jgi:hypothetical protein